MRDAVTRKSLSFDLDPIWFTDAVPGLFSVDSRVINNDFERQPRIRRGQIDTIDQAMEKWLRRTTRLTFSLRSNKGLFLGRRR